MSVMAAEPRPPEATSAPPLEVDGSRLCLACGLCCQGVFHDRVRVSPEEVGAVEALGLAVHAGKETPVFDLPCPRLCQRRCAVYEQRPSSCSGYRCKLLGRYLGGEIDLERGVAIVERAHGLLASLYERLGAREPGATVWRQIQERSASGTAEPELLLEAAALLTYGHRYFKKRSTGEKVVA